MFKVLKAASSLATPNTIRTLASDALPTLKVSSLGTHTSDGSKIPVYKVSGPDAICFLKKSLSKSAVIVPHMIPDTYGVISENAADQSVLSQLVKKCRP